MTDQGDCLLNLGRLEDAADAYGEAIGHAKARNALRDLAVAKLNLGIVRNLQHRYEEALAAYEEARKTFETMGEPATVARAWHQIGMVHQDRGQVEAAEWTYRESLVIRVRLGNQFSRVCYTRIPRGQAGSLALARVVTHRLEPLPDAAMVGYGARPVRCQPERFPVRA